MGIIESTIKNREKTMDLIWRTLRNRSDDNDIDWDDNEDINSEIGSLLSSKEIFCCPGEKLLINCGTDYFFISIKDKKQVKSLDDYIKKIFDEFYNCNNNTTHVSNIKSNKKIAMVFLVENLETRAFVDKIFISKRETYVEHLKELVKVKVKIEHLFILNQKRFDDAVEINNVVRYSTLQEPPLINSINFTPEQSKKNKKIGYVSSVNLLELIHMYNVVGDQLFDNNVRYGISEQLGVNEAIKRTLEKEGGEFWYRNNGITILVKSDEFQLDNPNKIVFRKKDDFSVINGAQTITVASTYYYETLANMENCDKGDEIEKYKKVLESINDARVLLRIICIREADEKERKAVNEISVALNRQKPIKVEDIAYTFDYISDLIAILGKCDLGEAEFSLKKRGEQNSTKGAMDLVEFSRARLACIGDPVLARNGSASTFLKKSGAEFDNKDIFAECDTEEKFKKNFNAIRFAHDLSKEYSVSKKEILRKRSKDMSDDDKKYNNLINNAKWMFVSHVIETLNNGTTDFSGFSYTIDDMNVSQMIKEYFDQAYEYTGKIDIETFKTRTWYKEMKDNIDMKKVIVKVKKKNG